MKSYKLSIPLLALLLQSTFANTYVWEDYDDFSGSTLDTVKWDLSCFDGGNLPIISNGQVLLAGNTNSSWNDTIVTARMLATNSNAASTLAGGGEAHSVLEFKESDDIYGIELYLTLPNDVSTDCGIGIYAIDYNAMFNGNEESSIRFDLDLWHGSGNPEVQVSWKNPSTGNEEKTSSITVSKATPIKLAFIRNENEIEFFYNDQSIATGNYQNVNETFFIRAVSETGASFANSVDNVRVLRRATTTSLDGSIFTLSSSDGVSETLSFENGTLTSTFVDPAEGTIVTSNQSYLLDPMSSNSWKITPNDGDIYFFDSSAGTGTLTDYENGVIDTSGSWNFTFERYVWEDYDDFSGTNINSGNWNLGYWDGGNAPTIGNGKITLSGNNVSGFNSVLPSTGMLTFNAGIKAELEKSFASTNGTESHSFLELANNDILGINVEVTLPSDAHSSTAIGLYASDWTKAFSDDLSDKSFFGLDLWSDHIDIEYVDPNTGSFVSSSISTQAGSSHVFSFVFGNSVVFMHVDGVKVAEFPSVNFSRDSILIRAMNEAGEPFTASIDNVRVLRNWEDYDDFSSGPLDTTKWELAWWKGGRSPSVVNGALELSGSGDTNDPESDSMPYQLSLLTIPENMSTHPHAIITDSSVYGLEAEMMLPGGSQYSTGLNFLCFDTTSQKADGSFKQFGPEIEYWSGQSPSLEYQYLSPVTGEAVQVSLPANFGVYYKASLIQDGSKSLIFIDGKKVAEFDYPEFSPNTFGFFAFNDDGHAFETYVKNVRVLRRSTTTTQPDPVTVVSDPNGQAVVVQVGNEYQWNRTLDGVTLWMVHEDDDDGWFGATIQYVSSRQQGSIGLTDQVGSNLVVNHPYVIDENEMIKVTENTAFQYYQVTAVENGVIITADGSSFPLSDTSRFFTTRAAAEEYYYSKVNPKDWMWFDNYPWVYSNEMKEWLYFYPSGSKLLYYSNKNKAWREFSQ